MGSTGRRPDFPELQEKIEQLLPQVFGPDDDVLSGPEIKERLSQKHGSLFSTEELNAIHNRWGNYASRAMQNGVLISLGTAKGYRLWKADERRESDRSQTTSDDRQYWESFLHFPATLWLSNSFEARVLSLPAKLTNQTWSNPDLLMVRHNNLHSLVQGVISPDLLSNLDNSPAWIISSIEAKFGLGTNRRAILDALSETAFNGSWANETWLLYGDPPDGKTYFDSDALAFAERNGIGIIGLIVENIDEKSVLNLEVIIKAATRPALSMKADFGSQGNKVRLAQRIQELLDDFNDRGTYLDLHNVADPTDDMSVADLMFDAVRNLATQTGFKIVSTSNGEPIDFAKLSKRAMEVDSKTTEHFFQAISNNLESLVAGSELPTTNDAWKSRLGRLEAHKLETVLGAFTVLSQCCGLERS